VQDVGGKRCKLILGAGPTVGRCGVLGGGEHGEGSVVERG
jgi:hypothetical protein